MKWARIPSFKPEILHPSIHQESYNDLKLGAFLKSNLARAGNRKKGATPLTENSSFYLDHEFRTVRKSFHFALISDPPHEITDALDWVESDDNETSAAFWGAQLGRISALMKEVQTARENRNNSTPGPIREHARLQAVSARQLMHHFDLVEDAWVRQFIFGFPTTGVLSPQRGFPDID